MSRFASTRPVRREDYHSQQQRPSEGHPEGVPEFPAALPGLHHYGTKTAVPVEHELEVGPADPYYGKGGMAHGVPAPVQHGGRPTARPEDRAEHGTRELVDAEERPRPDPVPVYVVDMGGGARPLKRAALQSKTVPAPGGDPIVLVNRDPHRSSVRLLNESGNPVRLTQDLTLSGGALLPANMTSYLEIDTEDEICAYVPVGSGAAGVQAEGTQTSPAAFTTIAIIAATSLPAGLYNIEVVLNLAGTVTQGTDNNNFKLVAGALSTVLDNEIVAGNQPFGPFEWQLPGATSILVQSIAAATSGAIYSVLITATPVDPSGGNGPAVVSVIAQYDVAAGG